MKRRRRQNVVTFFGEFASFVIESIFGMILQLMIVYHDKNNFNGFVPFLGIFAQAILTITFFLASPFDDLRALRHNLHCRYLVTTPSGETFVVT